jgi:hypothetical protein
MPRHLERYPSYRNLVLDDDRHDPKPKRLSQWIWAHVFRGKIPPETLLVYVQSRATYAQSHQRRFRRWLSNRRIDVMASHHGLVRHALCKWGNERMYLSLDTTMVWNCTAVATTGGTPATRCLFCIVWVGVVYRGRTVPMAWRVVAQSSSTVRLWTICEKTWAGIFAFASNAVFNFLNMGDG